MVMARLVAKGRHHYYLHFANGETEVLKLAQSRSASEPRSLKMGRGAGYVRSPSTATPYPDPQHHSPVTEPAPIVCLKSQLWVRGHNCPSSRRRHTHCSLVSFVHWGSNCHSPATTLVSLPWALIHSFLK
jgi:hypothetical protein